jgi:putative spermidine/putrescine transport system substrate-binding protein
MGRTTGIIIAAAVAIAILAGVFLVMLRGGSESEVNELDKEMSDMPLPSADGTAAAPAPAAGGASLAGKSLVVVSWGGAYTTSQIEAYHKPFQAQTGAKINSVDYNGGIAEIKAQVEAKNVTWDVVDMELADAQRACDEGLLEKIDAGTLPAAPDGTPALQDFIPNGITQCAVTTIVFSHIVAYDTSKFTTQPTKLADFFDVKNFPGKRGLRKTSPKINLELALRADGVPGDQVYQTLSTKEGVARAFKKLDSIKNDVIWWEPGSQPPQLLADGQVTMTTAYNGRIFDAQIKEGKPFAIIWDGQLQELDVLGIVKGTKNLDAAVQFVAFATDTQRLADQAKWIAYGPARKSSLPLVGTYHDKPDVDMKVHMPNAPENSANAMQIDFLWWADHQEELNQRWAAWLAK